MGYTHYWDRPETIPQEKFDEIVADFRKLLPKLRARGIRLRYDHDEDEPAELSHDAVHFNGVDEDGYETFYFPRVYKPQFRQEAKKGLLFQFTKTAHQPYDLAVTSFLLIAKHHLGNEIVVSSDGDDDDWDEATELVQKTLKYGDDLSFDDKGELNLCPTCKKELSA